VIVSSGRGGLVTPPSPRSLSADSNRPRQRRKRTSSSRGRGRSTSIEVIDRGAESECSTTSTHPSLGRPYTPSLPDDSSDADSLRKDSTDSSPNSLQNSKDADSVHQLETPESSIHRAPVTSVPWADSPVPDSLASSISKGFGHDNAAQKPPPFDTVSLPLSFYLFFWGVLNMFVVAHDNSIDCCWSRYLKHSGRCCYMASQTRVAQRRSLAELQKEIKQ